MPRRQHGAIGIIFLLVAAQAAGDAQVLADHGRPVLRIHLTDPEEGLRRLREALA